MDRLMSVFKDSQSADTYRHVALALATVYARSADLKNMNRFLPYCDVQARSDIGLNVSLMEGGDLVFDQKDYIRALELYRMVQLSGELKGAYDQRLKALKDELSKPSPWVPLRQREAQEAGREDDQIRYEQMLKERQELDVRNYDLELMIRMARCYEAMGRNWQAYLIFKHIYTGFPENPLAEQCRYFAFQSLISLKEQEAAKAEGYAYVKLYPQGSLHDELTLSLMNLHLAMNEADKAAALGKDLLAQQPAHRFADQVSYLLGYVQFEQQNYEAALRLFSDAATKWPTGVYAQDSVYWTGMCNLFLERFDEAIAVFEGYLNNPVWEKKEFAEDATYRLGMAFRGKGDAVESEKIFRLFLVQFPESKLRSEVLSLTGDLHGAGGDLNAELDAYRQARDCAVNTEQKTRAVFEMARVYKLQKNYAGIIALMEEYLATSNSKGDFAGAGRWMVESCRTPDDCNKTLAACGKILIKYGNDPQFESIDLLIETLTNEKPTGNLAGTFNKRIKSCLASDREAACRDGVRKTLCLRLTALFAEISEGADRDLYVNVILGEKDMTVFSPFSLLLFARESAARTDMDRVQAAYEQFRKTFISSELMPDMANIETSVLLSTGKYAEALKMAQENLQKVSGNPKEGVTQKLAADALRLMKDYDGAVELYNRFLSVREWRGPLTPQVIYWIGVCRYEQGRFEEAFAFFQRVYVLYEGYPEWASKAYEGSANCLRKLGRQEEVVKTLREMVSNEAVAATPEGRRAQAELSKLPEGSR
jgi:tetratricopeptide (TPR) repeat protein